MLVLNTFIYVIIKNCFALPLNNTPAIPTVAVNRLVAGVNTNNSS